MREIKFRMWVHDVEIEDGFMVEPAYLFPDGWYYDGDIYDDSCIIPMQYTGVRNKNNKEIYEGDICRFYPGFGCEWEPYVGEVVWQGSAFMTKRKGRSKGSHSMSFIDWECGCEVIGNIYETPELLEAK